MSDTVKKKVEWPWIQQLQWGRNAGGFIAENYSRVSHHSLTFNGIRKWLHRAGLFRQHLKKSSKNMFLCWTYGTLQKNKTEQDRKKHHMQAMLTSYVQIGKGGFGLITVTSSDGSNEAVDP